jgi:hypothetical protein
MQHPCPTSWKESYERAVRESDKRKLTELVRVAEEGMFLRGRDLSGSMNHQEERSEMTAAAADLLVVKIYKLGWPNPKPRWLARVTLQIAHLQRAG